MAPSLSAYENQVNKFRQTGELLAEQRPAPVLLPCHTLVNLDCRQGRKLSVHAFPKGVYQFAGYWDSMDDFHRCMAINNTYAGALAELRAITVVDGEIVRDSTRWKLLRKFTIPDYEKLRGVRRPGLAVPYVW